MRSAIQRCAGSQIFVLKIRFHLKSGGRLRRTNENAPLCAPLDGSINAHVGAQNAIQTHPERSFFDGTANIRNALSSGWHFWLSCILFSI